MPGTLGGAFVVDYLGPKYTMVYLLPSDICIFFMLSFLDHWSFVASSYRFYYERRVWTVRPSVVNFYGGCDNIDVYFRLTKHVGGFAVVYGIFLSFGELGTCAPY
jgi:hypothetical protein